MVMNVASIVKGTLNRRRINVGDVVTAAFTRRSVPEVRAERLASRRQMNTALVPGAQGVRTQGRLSYQHRGGGWTRVTVRDVALGIETTFSLRTPVFSELLHKRGMFYDPAQAMYSRWINTTKAGYLYSQRRQVEGMLKTAIKKGDVEMASKLEQILKMSDEKVAQFREAWVDAHTDVEMDEFYEYDDTTENTQAVVEWD